jgi:hypothetical protein
MMADGCWEEGAAEEIQHDYDARRRKEVFM